MQRVLRRTHAMVWSGLAIVLPLLLIALIWMRPDSMRDRPSLQIEPPSAGSGK